MRREVDCVILWHTYNLKGQLTGSSSTHLMGSMDNLNNRLHEAETEATANQIAGRPYTVAAQIIANRI